MIMSVAATVASSADEARGGDDGSGARAAVASAGKPDDAAPEPAAAVASGEVNATRAAEGLEEGVAVQRVVETDELRVESGGNTREAIIGSGIFGLSCCDELSWSAESGAKADACSVVVER